MSDDLIKRARAAANGVGSMKTEKGDFGLIDDLADRIRELEAERDRLREILQWQVDLIDKTVTPNGTDVSRLQLEDGLWHTGPVVDWAHKTLKGWQSIARAALQTDTDTGD